MPHTACPSGRFTLALTAAALWVAPSTWAAGTAPPPRQPPPPPASTAATSDPNATGVPDSVRARLAHGEAEKEYVKGWALSEEAKKEAVSGKADSAKKKFGKALKRFDEATQLDPGYFLAWNMVGFCARKSGDLKRSFAAYRKCLDIEPEYARAHEYLGEAFLMGNELGKAKEQLAWLQSRQAEEAAELNAKIEAFEKGGWSEVEKISAAEKAPGANW